jgi:hypothetical protein
MQPLRRFLCAHRRLAALVLLAVLLMKAVVPAGMMLGLDWMVLTVSVCTDATGGPHLRQIVVPREQQHGFAAGEHGKAEGICPFAALALPVLGGAGPALLAVALAFIAALGLAATRPLAFHRAVRWRPPLRAPPTLA